MKDTDNGSESWWDRRLFGLWVLVNGAAFLVIPLAGLLLEQLASAATRDLIHDHRALVVFVTAAMGAAAQRVILGRWQWRLLRRRVPDLERGRWVIATLAPAFFVWLLVIAPGAVDILAAGGDTLTAFGNGFVQALVLGPLIGLSQATAFRGHSTRWAWWLVANVVTYLSGAALHRVGVCLQHGLSLPGWAPGFFPVVAIAIHGIWMLWVTAPAATSRLAAVTTAPVRRAPGESSDIAEPPWAPTGAPSCSGRLGVVAMPGTFLRRRPARAMNPLGPSEKVSSSRTGRPHEPPRPSSGSLSSVAPRVWGSTTEVVGHNGG